MQTNPLFQSNYHIGSVDAPEHNLYQDLIIESIQIYGLDVKYIPRKLVQFDRLLGEDLISEFDKTYDIEMYIKSFDQFGGDGDFLSKFDVEVRDELVLQVARKRFTDVITADDEQVIRPREGDLIFFPFSNRLFEIKFVEHEEVFYQVGKLFTYEIRCNLFEYNSEKFDTGVDVIDDIKQFAYTTILDLTSGTGEFIEGEIVQQGTQVASVVSWDSPRLTVQETKGKFKAGSDPIIGQDSMAEWIYSDTQFQENNQNSPRQDNNFIEEEFDKFDVPTGKSRLL